MRHGLIAGSFNEHPRTLDLGIFIIFLYRGTLSMTWVPSDTLDLVDMGTVQ